ncbi:MAG: winged helix-turn-helix domain-containing protein [Labilithrix sp.]|nr:winged helix-turn-helix domain-containing protein [Labilithrix sp.]
MRRSQRPEVIVQRAEERRWSLLTAHAEVLFCIAQNPDTRVREIADVVGISERGAHQIVADLVDAGYVRRARIGRRNHYAIESRTALKHTPVRHRRVASIIALLGPEPARAERAEKARRLTRSRSRATDGAVAKTPTKRRAA